MDPSPRSELEAIQTRNSSWADSWRWVYDRIDFLWNSSVVGFDTRTQAMLAKRASGTWEDRLESLLNSALEGVRSVNRFFRLGPAGYIWMTVILALAVSSAIAKPSSIKFENANGADVRIQWDGTTPYLHRNPPVDGGLASPQLYCS